MRGGTAPGVCIVGVGYWGKNLARNLADLGALVAVCDQDGDARKWAGKRFPGLPVAAELREVLRGRGVDAVAVATPPEAHYSVAREALEAGCHVLLEKPFTGSIRLAGELTELAERRGLILMGGFTFLYNEAVRKVKEYIRSGHLGQIYYVLSQRLNLGKIRSDVDVWWNLGPHDASIILYWFDDLPVEVSGWGVSYLQRDISDIAFVCLRFEDGRAAFVHVSWLDPNKKRSAIVVGSSKMVVYDDTSPDKKVQIYDQGIDRLAPTGGAVPFEDFGQFQLIQRSGDIHIPRLDFEEPLRKECRHFLECVKGNGACLTDGMLSLRVLKILEAAHRSIAEKGKPIRIRGA